MWQEDCGTHVQELNCRAYATVSNPVGCFAQGMGPVLEAIVPKVTSLACDPVTAAELQLVSDATCESDLHKQFTPTRCKAFRQIHGLDLHCKACMHVPDQSGRTLQRCVRCAVGKKELNVHKLYVQTSYKLWLPPCLMTHVPTCAVQLAAYAKHIQCCCLLPVQ